MAVRSCARGDVRHPDDIDVAILPRGDFPSGFFAKFAADFEESPIPHDLDLINLREADNALRDEVLWRATRWQRPWKRDFANSVLYRLCEEHPDHTREDVIIAKVWLPDASSRKILRESGMRRWPGTNRADFDLPYADFFARCEYLSQEVSELLGRYPSPRELDKVLVLHWRIDALRKRAAVGT
jgi:predicted nucleotidyltransferase